MSASERHAAEVKDAYAACARLAREHYENFPVASRLLPPAMRPHVAAVYGFARVADDFADEGDRSVEERHALLDWWLTRLRSCAADSDGSGLIHDPGRGLGPGEAGLKACSTGVVTEADAARIFLALSNSIRACRLPLSPFEDLLSAFRQDVTVHRYAAWTDVLDYCRRSANPVGRLVLRIAGHDDPALDAASDALCTALQLTNFWQDLDATGRRAGCTCRQRTRRHAERARPTWTGACWHRNGNARWHGPATGPARCLTSAARCATKSRAGCAWSCA